MLCVSPNRAVLCMLCSGADKDAKNADGKTALEVAELNEKADVVAVFAA